MDGRGEPRRAARPPRSRPRCGSGPAVRCRPVLQCMTARQRTASPSPCGQLAAQRWPRPDRRTQRARRHQGFERSAAAPWRCPRHGGPTGCGLPMDTELSVACRPGKRRRIARGKSSSPYASRLPLRPLLRPAGSSTPPELPSGAREGPRGGGEGSARTPAPDVRTERQGRRTRRNTTFYPLYGAKGRQCPLWAALASLTWICRGRPACAAPGRNSPRFRAMPAQ